MLSCYCCYVHDISKNKSYSFSFLSSQSPDFMPIYDNRLNDGYWIFRAAFMNLKHF